MSIQVQVSPATTIGITQGMMMTARKTLRARIGWASATAEAKPKAYSPATETTVQTHVCQSEGQKWSSSSTVVKLSRPAKPTTLGLVRLT